MPLFWWYLAGGVALIVIVGYCAGAHRRNPSAEYPRARRRKTYRK